MRIIYWISDGSSSHLHSYPFCYRCGTPLFYNAVPAWFIDVQKLKSELIKQNETINWYPEHLKHGRFMKGLESAHDWNLYRSRYWGPDRKRHLLGKSESVSLR